MEPIDLHVVYVKECLPWSSLWLSVFDEIDKYKVGSIHLRRTRYNILKLSYNYKGKNKELYTRRKIHNRIFEVSYVKPN